MQDPLLAKIEKLRHPDGQGRAEPRPWLGALLDIAAAAREEHQYLGPQSQFQDTESGRLYSAVDTALKNLDLILPASAPEKIL